MGSLRGSDVSDPPQTLYPSQPPHRRALARYVALWLVAGAAVAVIGLQLLRGAGENEPVVLPPLRETELVAASRTAGCDLRRERGARALQPAVSGPPAIAGRPGVYEQTPPPDALIGALRRGIIVIHYRPSLADEPIAQLQRLQAAVPRATIVTPNENMRYEVAVTAWRRLLGCDHFREATIDAIRFFRGRYVGLGPD